MKKTMFAAFLSLFTGVSYLLPLTAIAQDEPPDVVEMWLFTPKEGQMAEFLEAVREHGALREEHKDPRDWRVYTPVVSDEMNRVAIRYCCGEWADSDAYDRWYDENPAVLEHWAETAAPHVAKSEHFFELMDWGNSHWNSENNTQRYYGVTTWNIKGGHHGDFIAAREKISQIAINQGWASDERNWLWMTMVGGPSSESIVIPFKNYAAMAGGEETFVSFLARHLGSEEEAANLLKQLDGSSWGSSYTIWEYHPDLSTSDDD